MNLKKYSLVSLLALSMVMACTSDFEDINNNPNGPVVIPSYLHLPSMIEQTADQMFSTFNGGDMGETWVQHWGKVQYNNEERYEPRVTSINDWWNLLYARPLMDSKKMYEFAVTEGNQKSRGIALIWQTYVFSLLTDSFGDVPYSDALSAEGGATAPVYDKQSAIYPAMIDSLESAIGYLSGSGEVPAVQDIMYGGDTDKWEKFANSLRFRLLMRISGKSDVSAQLKEIATSGVYFKSNADNAQLNFKGQNPNANPIWNTIVFSTRLEWKINESLVTVMDGLSDPRLPVYAQENEDGEIRGCAPGIEEPTINGYTYANTSAIGEYFLQPSTPGVFMDYAELNFLMAEAAKKGFIDGGDGAAKVFYDNGIKASFSTYNGFKLADGSTIALVPDLYLAQSNVAYDPTNALTKIGTQKWIALYAQGLEAWSEWRRTKIPTLSPAVNPIGINEIPSRYYYPSLEQSLNPKNYNDAKTSMGGDLLTTKVWWMN